MTKYNYIRSLSSVYLFQSRVLHMNNNTKDPFSLKWILFYLIYKGLIFVLSGLDLKIHLPPVDIYPVNSQHKYRSPKFIRICLFFVGLIFGGATWSISIFCNSFYYFTCNLNSCTHRGHTSQTSWATIKNHFNSFQYYK